MLIRIKCEPYVVSTVSLGVVIRLSKPFNPMQVHITAVQIPRASMQPSVCAYIKNKNITDGNKTFHILYVKRGGTFEKRFRIRTTISYLMRFFFFLPKPYAPQKVAIFQTHSNVRVTMFVYSIRKQM